MPEWASATEHVRTWKSVPSTSRKRCSCGCKTRATRMGLANGMGMMTGCDLLVMRWVRDGR